MSLGLARLQSHSLTCKAQGLVDSSPACHLSLCLIQKVALLSEIVIFNLCFFVVVVFSFWELFFNLTCSSLI